MIRKFAVCVLSLLLFTTVATAGENLTFSGVPPTLLPQTYGQFYQNISENDKDWATIANVIPRPFVDYFGENSELGWQVFFMILVGSMFVILFGRQSNVILPVIMFLISGVFILSLIPTSMGRWAFTLFAGSVAGVIVFFGRRKR